MGEQVGPEGGKTRTLILTEKPSVAKDFAKALGIEGRKDGYIEGKGYVVTWAIGHLLELAEPGDYDARWLKWNLNTLPILPDHLEYKPIAKVEKQLAVVKKQLGRKDIGRIVIATDAGREGEVIARTVLEGARGILPPVYRFWTSQALTPHVVLETLTKKLKPASDYDRLWHAGQARQIADWLVGMNFTRAATLKMGGFKDVYSVGRVQTAVLALLVDRKRERENFKPEPYWLLRARFSNDKGMWWGTWFRGDTNRFTVREEAERVLSTVRDKTGRIRSVKREKKKQPPPLLYSLTDLQREANARYGLSAQKTLDIAQGLYENRKCLSYPRTDSKVLGSQNVNLVEKLVEKLSSRYPDLFSGIDSSRISLSNKRVFNDAKLTDHHALIPLAPLPEGANQSERRIYELVLKRFAAAFHPDYEYEATEAITEVGEETFRTKGTRPLVPGWKAVYGLKESSQGGAGEDEPEEEDLPLLEKGDPAKVEDVRLEDKMTQPPPEYTEALLLKDMTNPSRYVSEEVLQKVFKGEVGLGTQATRAQIIETLLTRRYIVREKKKLMAVEKGCVLIDNLRRFGRAGAVATPEETARWEMELEKIAQGAGNPGVFMDGIRKLVEDGVEEFKMSEAGGATDRFLGKCPACGGNIIEGRKGYGCSNWRSELGGCRFVVWKEISGGRVTPEIASRLLAEGTSPAMMFRSKEGREYQARLRLVEDERNGTWATRLEFLDRTKPAAEGADTESVNSATDTEPLGMCPRCGGEVVEGKKGYGCSKWRDQDGGCRFVIWKQIAGRKISRDIARELLQRGETGLIDGFVSKKGREFSARLRLEGEDYRAAFVFE